MSMKFHNPPASKSLSRSFTLIELIVVIIIVGILAAVGMTQYSTIVEKSRIAEVKTRTGTMRQLANEYYLGNGTINGISDGDLGTGAGCSSTGWYEYHYYICSSTKIMFHAFRCTSGGKNPDYKGSQYRVVYRIDFATGREVWGGVLGDSALPGLPYADCGSPS